jgi:hypothetical protein
MNATDNPNAGGQTSEENLSVDELVLNRLGEMAETEDQVEEFESEAEETEEYEDSQEYEETEEYEADEVEEVEDETEVEEEAEEIDLLDLTPEQIQTLAKKGKSRLLERIGELTAKNKALEEKLTIGQAQAQQAPVVAPNSNPFRDLQSFDEIAAKQKELEATLETTDSLLEDYEGYGPDDVITVGNREFTKKQIRQANRNAREAITKFLPAQASQLQKIQQLNAMSEKYVEAAFNEVPELHNENSEVSIQFQALAADPLVERLKKEIPELGMQIEYLLAHAARSIFGGKKSVTTGAGMKLKAKPPASPGGAGTARTMKPKDVKTQEASKRYMETGSFDDLVAARIARIAK